MVETYTYEYTCMLHIHVYLLACSPNGGPQLMCVDEVLAGAASESGYICAGDVITRSVTHDEDSSSLTYMPYFERNVTQCVWVCVP